MEEKPLGVGSTPPPPVDQEGLTLSVPRYLVSTPSTKGTGVKPPHTMISKNGRRYKLRIIYER